MSDEAPTTVEPPRPAPDPPRAAPEPVPLRCPRCGAHVAPEQDWCLECGAPARTRLAPTPNWRLPIALIVAIVLAAGVALALAFVALTDDSTPAAATSTAAPAQPAESVATQTVPAPPPVTETAPAATTPPATTPTQPPTTGPTPTTPGG